MTGTSTENSYFFSDDSEVLNIDLLTDQKVQKYSFYYNEVKDGVIYKSSATKLNLAPNEDNIPPFVYLVNACSDYIYISCGDYVNNSEYDSPETLLEENGVRTITVYYRLIQSTLETKLTEEQIKKLPYKKLKVIYNPVSDQYFTEQFFLDDFGDKQGKYMFYIYAEDNAHNYCLEEYRVDIFDNKSPVYMTQIDSNYGKVYFDTFNFKENSSFEVYRMSREYQDSRWSWFATMNYSNPYDKNLILNDDKPHCTKVYADFEKLAGNFIKIQESDNDGFSVPKYYYIGLNIRCTIKNVIEKSSSGGLKEYLIEHNEPVFVETVYGSYNYGNNIDKWTRWIAEEHRLNYQIFDSGSTVDKYQLNVYSNIPSGNYYAVIVHYADGTSDISDVYYKD